MYHVGLHSLAVLGPPLVDVFPSRVGAHKADGFDGRMVTDEVHRYKKIQPDEINPLFFTSAPFGNTIIMYKSLEYKDFPSRLKRS